MSQSDLFYTTVLNYNVNKYSEYSKLIYLYSLAKTFQKNPQATKEIIEYINGTVDDILDLNPPPEPSKDLISSLISNSIGAVGSIVSVFQKSPKGKALSTTGQYIAQSLNSIFWEFESSFESGTSSSPIQNEYGAQIKTADQVLASIKYIVETARSNTEFRQMLDDFAIKAKLTNSLFGEGENSIESKNPDAFLAKKVDDVSDAISEIQEDLENLSSSYEKLSSYINEQISAAQKQKDLKDIKKTYSEIGAAVTIFTLLLSQKDADAAARIGAALQATIKFAEMAQIFDKFGAAAPFGPVGLAAAAIVAVFSIAGLFGKKKKQKAQNEAFMKALMQISRQISEVRRLLKTEAKQIRSAIEALRNTMIFVIEPIIVNQGKLIKIAELTNEKIDELQAEVTKRLDGLDQKLDTNIQLSEEIFEAVLLQKQKYWLTAKSDPLGGLDRDQFNEASAAFAEFATSGAVKAQTTYLPTADNNIVRFLYVYQSLAGVETKSIAGVPHLDIWIAGARRFLELIRQYPEYTYSSNADGVGQVIVNQKVFSELDDIISHGQILVDYLKSVMFDQNGGFNAEKLSKIATFVESQLIAARLSTQNLFYGTMKDSFFGYNPWAPDNSRVDDHLHASLDRVLTISGAENTQHPLGYENVPQLENGVKLNGLSRLIDPTIAYFLRVGKNSPVVTVRLGFSSFDESLHFFDTYLGSGDVIVDRNDGSNFLGRIGSVRPNIEVSIHDSDIAPMLPEIVPGHPHLSGKEDLPSVFRYRADDSLATFFVRWQDGFTYTLHGYPRVEETAWTKRGRFKELKLIHAPSKADYAAGKTKPFGLLKHVTGSVANYEERLYSVLYEFDDKGQSKQLVRYIGFDEAYPVGSKYLNYFTGSIIAQKHGLKYVPHDSAGVFSSPISPQDEPATLLNDTYYRWWKEFGDSGLPGTSQFASVSYETTSPKLEIAIEHIRISTAESLLSQVLLDLKSGTKKIEPEEDLAGTRAFFDTLAMRCARSAVSNKEVAVSLIPVEKTVTYKEWVPKSEAISSLLTEVTNTGTELNLKCKKVEGALDISGLSYEVCEVEKTKTVIVAYKEVTNTTTIAPIAEFLRVDLEQAMFNDVHEALEKTKLGKSFQPYQTVFQDPTKMDFFDDLLSLLRNLTDDIESLAKRKFEPDADLDSSLLSVLRELVATREVRAQMIEMLRNDT